MAFLVNLGTMAGLDSIEKRDRIALPLVIQSGSFRTELRMPDPGVNVVQSVDFRELRSKRSLSLDLERVEGLDRLNLNAELTLSTGSIRFGYRNIGLDDSIVILHVAPGRFVANVLHGKKAQGCRAICADGTEGQPCVSCRASGVVIRVCC